MIITEFYNGQGLGNQLWCYFVTKTIAKLNNYKFGIMSPNKFKGKEFMQLDFGESIIGGFGPEGGPPNILPNSITNYYKEKTEHHPISRLDISGQDLNLLNLLDNTKIDTSIIKEIVHKWKLTSLQLLSLKNCKYITGLALYHFHSGSNLTNLESLYLDSTNIDIKVETIRLLK